MHNTVYVNGKWVTIVYSPDDEGFYAETVEGIKNLTSPLYDELEDLEDDLGKGNITWETL